MLTGPHLISNERSLIMLEQISYSIVNTQQSRDILKKSVFWDTTIIYDQLTFFVVWQLMEKWPDLYVKIINILHWLSFHFYFQSINSNIKFRLQHSQRHVRYSNGETLELLVLSFYSGIVMFTSACTLNEILLMKHTWLARGWKIPSVFILAFV